MSVRERFRAELERLEVAGLRRVPRVALPPGTIDFASNDYLGLRRDPRVLAALHGADVTGSGGSRLLGGAAQEHADLEAELAEWLGRERALLFSSGYLAMLGVVTTLGRFVEVAYSDALVHACAIDALRLLKIPRRILPHATVAVRPTHDGAALIVTESVFGMDGTRAPLPEIAAALHDDDVLVIDEAHALGVVGEGGAGLGRALRDDRVVVVGTLSKAFGSAGGFVAGPTEAIALLATAARTFIYDTAAPPAQSAAARAALAILRSREGNERRARLHANAVAVRASLRGLGFAPSGEGPIVPVIVGAANDALAMAAALEARGIFAPAIRPPTVPPGTARLRITIRADHTDADLAALLDAISAGSFA